MAFSLKDISFPKAEDDTVFLDGKELRPPYFLPKGPLYLVWTPGGKTRIRYVFTRLEHAERAANNMAQRHQAQATEFYVAALISAHQMQHRPEKFPLQIKIV